MAQPLQGCAVVCLNADTNIHREATVLVGQHLFGIDTLDQGPGPQRRAGCACARQPTAYLRRFPIDQLKIDRSFVIEMLQYPDSAAIVNSIIGLARSLRLQTVGEGVETEGQRVFLQAAGCDLLQGYLFSRPVTADALLELVRRHHALPNS